MYRILIVDDEEIICRGISSVLNRIKNPYVKEIFVAFSGQEAEKLIDDLRPSIVISDICMPGMSGLDLIKSAKKIAPDIRFIVLSGHDEFAYVKEACLLGIEDYLLKPASLTKLREALEKVIASLNNDSLNKPIKSDNNVIHGQQGTDSVIKQAKAYIAENFRKDINMALVANLVSLNYSYFSTLFKEKTGLNFVEYVTKIRMEEAKKLLTDPALKIYDITTMVGYDHPKHFTRVFKSTFGISPKEFRAKFLSDNQLDEDE
jgi:two-component system, response regulator YesN